MSKPRPRPLLVVSSHSISTLTAKAPTAQTHFQNIYQACLAESDRDWTACQQQVKELKECTTLLASSSSKENKKKDKE